MQRQGKAFITGVLHENDLDYQVAKALAADVICEEAFQEIQEENYEKAKASLLKCRKVICAIDRFGVMNKKNEALLKDAEDAGLEVYKV